MIYYDTVNVFKNNKALCYCEDRGIYEVYSRKGNIITYYSLYEEGIYKVTVNVLTRKENRHLLKNTSATRIPKYLRDVYGNKYNYYSG